MTLTSEQIDRFKTVGGNGPEFDLLVMLYAYIFEEDHDERVYTADDMKSVVAKMYDESWRAVNMPDKPWADTPWWADHQ